MPQELSKLLEKLEAKYPEDKDVLAVVDEYENVYGDEMEEEDMEDLDMGMEEDMPMEEDVDMMPEEGPSFDELMAEDMDEEDPDLELDLEMPKKKKKPVM